MQRTPINPSSWSIKLGFDQAELVEDHQRLLVVSGQDAVDADGTPQHSGDMAAQLEMALDNLDAILDAADMTAANVVRLDAYTTDIDELFEPLSTHRGPVRGRQSLRDHRARSRAAAGETHGDAGGNRGRLRRREIERCQWRGLGMSWIVAVSDCG